MTLTSESDKAKASRIRGPGGTITGKGEENSVKFMFSVDSPVRYFKLQAKLMESKWINTGPANNSLFYLRVL